MAVPKVYLRPIENSDVSRYHSWLQDSEVTKFLEARFTVWTEDKVRQYIRENPYLFAVCVYSKELEVYHLHAGNIKLGNINWIHKLADIGLMIGDKTLWRKSICTEAISLITKYAFEVLGLHKVTAGCYAENIWAISAFQKAGFQIEGVLKNHYLFESKYTDAVILGKRLSEIL